MGDLIYKQYHRLFNFKIVLVISIIIILLSLIISCNPQSSDGMVLMEKTEGSSMIKLEENEIQRTVADSAQVTVEDLKIGVGNIWVADYNDENGNKHSGLTTGLWFFIRDNDELNRHERAYIGQIISIAGYQIRILDIKKDGPVTIGITPPKSE